MSQRIHHLDSLTIDKIAAGEVIDVPAACVKELVENSLDAGATEILVEVALGGRELIRITDNGCGMGREDVIASIERHATSKLHDIDDLERLISRGFRGEALASIVAISQVTITSAEKNGEGSLCQATVLEVQGGKIVSIVDTQALPGTTIEVSSLFYNVPARRKFLKSPAKDTQDIIKTMTCLSLSSPHVAFRLLVDGRRVIDVVEDKTDPFVSRIRALFKDPFQNDAFEVHHAREGFSLRGLLADPRHARSTRAGQYLIVNGRCVQSLPISYAVKAAFGTTCEEGKHPQFVLDLTLDPSSIDVNVHPQKKEVRFADEEWVRMLVQESVSEALFGKRGFSLSPSISYSSPMETSEKDALDDPFLRWRSEEIEEVPSLPFAIPQSSTQTPSPICVAVIGDVALIKPPLTPDGHFPVSHDALLLLDLRQAMRAVIFNELKAQTESVMTELFFIPIVVDCSAQEAVSIAENIPYFEKIGFMIRSLGPQSYLIEGAPKKYIDIDLAKFIIDVSCEGVLSAAELTDDHRCKRLATAYVATMKSMHPPVDFTTATSILSLWSQQNFPSIAPDGAPCYSQLTSLSLKEWVAKGGSSTLKRKEASHGVKA